MLSLVALVPFITVACSSPKTTNGIEAESAWAATPAPGTPTIEVILDEWSITTSTGSVTSGVVTLIVSNRGSIPHELEMFLINDNINIANFPIKSGIAKPEHRGGTKIDEIDDGLLSTSDEVSATYALASGRYVLLCNLPGHYEAGMLADITAK